MIYIEVDENETVKYIHYMPLDDSYGLGKSEEELKETGYLVDEIPEPQIKEGFISIAKYNKKENKVWYEYEVEEEKEEDSIKEVKAQMQGLQQALAEVTLMMMGGGNNGI
jgi:hypothetical protein